jgi:DnaK suppressor protein
MRQDVLDQIRLRLEARSGDLKAAIAAGEKADVPIAPDKSLGRLTRMDALQSQQMTAALVQRNREELARVERALERLRSGDYGICGRCGEEIAEARLQAVPDAIVCRECAERPARR